MSHSAALHHSHRLLAPPAAVTLAVVALAVLTPAAHASAQQPPQLCQPGHNYDQPKGLCYDPAAR